MIVKKKYSKEIIELLKNPENRLAWEEEAVLDKFAVLVDKTMQVKNMKQVDLAKKLGKTSQALSRALGGDQNLTVRLMLQIAMGLGMTVDVGLTPLENIEEVEAPARVEVQTVTENYMVASPFATSIESYHIPQFGRKIQTQGVRV